MNASAASSNFTADRRYVEILLHHPHTFSFSACWRADWRAPGANGSVERKDASLVNSRMTVRDGLRAPQGPGPGSGRTGVEPARAVGR